MEDPPADVDPQQVSLLCRYRPGQRSPHRPPGISAADRQAGRTLEGLSGVHSDKTQCPPELANDHARVQDMLRQAVGAGHAGGWGQDSPYYPDKAWYRDPDTKTIYMARQNGPGSCDYHGYPLQRGEKVQGLP